ncbi:hypothetical protein GWK91_15530 [Virgibacillus sp. MSP4-1]|uniref:hypothetical protein n=1 Tax=Virgibacillus sp. MSP4-1 TaxID=2700081 RepID=UPI0003A8DD69|nr:hypothetical protein [Virgibacillus sp. MSP4-1]QHS24220.1 hypothetical protein GWK91_15530 [Virgibacillus sp. MSP4-1]
MRVKEQETKKNQTTISVLTLSTDRKVPPAKYESGFKKLDSKTGKCSPAKARALLRKWV